MSERGYSVRLSARVDSYVAAMKAAEASTAQLAKGSQANLAKLGGQMQAVGRKMTTYVTLPIVAAGVGAVVAATRWESSWAGVTKTVDGTASQMERLEGGLRSMAKELPATHTEIASVAEAAGQLGVGVGDIEEFTRVMIDLGETTNLTADQAATSLARFSNIMGTPTSNVRMLGDVIVELGNNSATTEAEIVELGTRLAAAGKIAGLSEADVFAFAATLTSVGVEAEAGGTALSKVFTAVRDSVLTGSDALDVFAKVAGQTTTEFAAAFNADPAQAIAGFIAGLGRMNAAGQSTTSVFQELELTDQRLMRALLSTGEAGDLLTDSLTMANDAASEGGALAAEAAVRYETFGSKMEVLRNQVVDLGITVGNALIPAISALATGVGAAVDAFAALPGPVQLAVGVLLAVAAAAGPVIFVTGSIIKNLIQIKAAAALLSGLSFSWLAAGPWIAGAAAIGAVGLALWSMGNKAQESSRKAAEVADEIRANVAAAAEEAAASFADLVRALDATDDPAGLVSDRFRDMAAEMPQLSAALSGAGFTFDDLAEAALSTGGRMDGMGRSLMAAAQDAGYTRSEAINMNEALREMSQDAYDASVAAGDLAAAAGEPVDPLNDTAAAAAEAAAPMLALVEAQRAYVDEVMRGISSQFDYQQSIIDLDNANADLAEQMVENYLIQMDGKRSDEEKAQSSRDLESQEIRTAEAALRAATAFAEQSGASQGSVPYVQAQIDKLVELSDRVHPSLRGQIQDTIDKMLSVPGTVDTRVNVETADAERRLRDIGASMARLQSKTITLTLRTVGSMPGINGAVPRHDGGPVRAGQLYEVGERNVAEMYVTGGRQYMIPGNDGNIIPGSKLTPAPAAAPRPTPAPPRERELVGAGVGSSPQLDPVTWGRQAADAISRRLQQNGRSQ